MALSIKHPQADLMARELARTTGETLTEAIVNALRERLTRLKGQRRTLRLRDEIRAIRERCASLPVLDSRSADEILGYDEHGLPR